MSRERPMRLADTWLWVWRVLASRRRRSLLTGLGIAVGIAAVALLTAVGEGLRLYMMESFTQFGTRLIAVTPGKVGTHGLAGVLPSTRPLRLEDLPALAALPGMDAVVPVVSGTARVEFGGRGRDVDVFGVGHQAAQAWRFRVALGQFLPDDDPLNARPLAVLGHRLREELFGNSNPLGQPLRIGGMRFRVVGVMESKGQFLGFDLDDSVFIPSSRGLQLFNREGLMEIDFVFSEALTAQQAAERIRARLTALHGREDFTLFTQEDMLAALDRILTIMTAAVAGLGGISLLVGGVGVLTIMSTALHERLAEIGLLRALGSSRGQLLWLFLWEAVVLAGLGGLAGIAVVVVSVLIVKLLLPALPLVLAPVYLLAAWALSAVVGLAAGIYPAWQAARTEPIAALRAE